MQYVNSVQQVWKRTLRIAVAFWAACLILVTIEATAGANMVLGVVFFLSIPVLVGYLTWANKDIMVSARRGLLSVIVLGISVLLFSSVIILIGLLAAAKLKGLILGV